MTQRLLQGQINHIQWVMVDSTDFATPESALSAAMNIKIYGTVIGNSNVFFVTSGVGSLAASNREVVHIGASATGIYGVPLGAAQLSDASNAFYDTYILHISATGAARQTLVFSGVRASLSDILSTMNSQFAVVSNYLSNASNFQSDILSTLDSQFAVVSNYLSNLSAMVSDVRSDVSDMHSDLLVMSDILSDFYSDFQSRVPKLVATNSQLSDLHSDLRSYLVLMSDAISDMHSDLGSKIGAITATLSVSDISDIASAVWAHTIGARVDSRLLLTQSMTSDVYSLLSDTRSTMDSQFTYMSNAVSDMHSDLGSKIGAITVTLTASDISDIASAVAAAVGSQISDIYSLLSDTRSTMDSQFAVVSNYLSNLSAMVSDTDSALTSQFVYMSNAVSDMHSDLGSKIGGITVTLTASDISDIASAVAVAVGSSMSDIYSLVSDFYSDFQSRVPKRVATDSQLSNVHSDLLSLVTTTGVGLNTATMSDVRSIVLSLSGMLSDTYSAAAQANSRVFVVQSQASDIYSLLSDVSSDLTIMSGVVSNIYSLLSDFDSDFDSRLPATLTELAAVPGATPTPQQAWMLPYMWLRNNTAATSAARRLRNDAGATIASAAIADDGTTFTQGKLA